MDVTQSAKRLQDLVYDYKRHLDQGELSSSSSVEGRSRSTSTTTTILDGYRTAAVQVVDALLRRSQTDADRRLQISAGVLLSAADLLVFDTSLHNALKRRSDHSITLCRKLVALLTSLTFQSDEPKQLLAHVHGFLNALCMLMSSHVELVKVREQP